jgi:hypothetical protein
MRLCVLAACGLAFAQLSWGQQPLIANSPKVEFKGVIESVQLVRGEGTPAIVVKTGDATVRVILGSMRYLMEQDFNPKGGAEVLVRGFKASEEDVYAISVTLPAENKTLHLRDEEGRPLWQRGRYGRGG